MKKYKPKYTFIKLVFIGKEPIDRKHAPKIIEYFQLGFGNLISIILSLLLLNYALNSSHLSEVLNGPGSKIILAFMLGNFLAMIATSSRLICIQKKTEEFKSIYLFAIIFSLLLVTSPLAIIFCYSGYKNNIIEYK